MNMSKDGIKLIANNKKAFHDYFIEDTYEAGIELAGTEVKSMRLGKCNLKDSYVHEYKGDIYVAGMHISPYEKGNIFNKDPYRERRLLLHRGEINKMLGYMATRHITHIYTGHYGQEECNYGINYIQDMGTLAKMMLEGNFQSEHHNRSAESSPVRMTTLRRATIVYHPDRVR